MITGLGERLTYFEVAKLADAFAAQLGDRRCLLMIEAKNELEPLIAYLGALRMGHPVLLTSDGSSQNASRVADTYAPNAVYAKTDGAWCLRVVSDITHELHHELALLLSTSGSTGATKLVRLSNRALQANAQSISKYLRIYEWDRGITTLPIHYSYGLSIVNSHLASGASIILTGLSVVDEEFWSIFQREKATSLAGVPYTYEMFDRVGVPTKELPSLRYMTQAGGRLPSATAQRYAALAVSRGAEFFVMYGQTEATARMAYLPPSEVFRHPDCIGVAIPGGNFKLIDECGTIITDADVAGELVYTGDNVMMGYAQSLGDLARGADIDELRTGDVAVRNTDGLYRLTGRISRFVKPFGLRIGLDEIERSLEQIGLRGTATGDDTIIAVALLGGDPKMVATFLAGRFRLPESIFDIVSLSELPLLASGKVDARAILLAAQTRASAVSSETPADPMAAIFSRTFRGRQVTADDSFASLGGDSLSYVNFSIEIEAALGTLPEGWENLTLAELRDLTRFKVTLPFSKRWRRIDSEVFLRALAIIAVIINHASSLVVGGGANVLLILVGFNLARFQLARLEQGDVAPMVMNLVTRVILPYYILLVCYLVFKRSLDWSALLLIGNFTGHYHSFVEPYWFLEALLQCTIIVAALFSAPVVQRAARANPWRLGIWMLLFSLALKAATFSVFHHKQLSDRTPDAVLYLLALGWCAYFARNKYKKIFVLMITVFVVSLSASSYPIDQAWNVLRFPNSLSHGIWLICSVILLLTVPKLLVPRWFATPMVVIASASFFIYLVHGVPVYFMLYVFHFDFLALTLALSVILGIVAARAVQWVSDFRSNKRLGSARSRPSVHSIGPTIRPT